MKQQPKTITLTPEAEELLRVVREGGGKIKSRSKDIDTSWYIAKEVFRKKNMTYQRFSDLTGMSVTAVNDMVNIPPSIVHIHLMSQVLGVPFSHFFRFEDNLNSPTSHLQDLHCPVCGAGFSVNELPEDGDWIDKTLEEMHRSDMFGKAMGAFYSRIMEKYPDDYYDILDQMLNECHKAYNP